VTILQEVSSSAKMRIDMGRVQLASQFPNGSDSESSREEGEIRSRDARSTSSLPIAESIYKDLRARDLSSVRRQIPEVARQMKASMEQLGRSLRTCGFSPFTPVCVRTTVVHRFYFTPR
jgi:hypothetical protein